MAKRTQKSGTTARFGSRYGVSVRRRAGAALKKKARHYTCPSCNYQKVRRKAAGIWECRKCNHTFSGGVWEPFTRATDSNNRIIRRSMEGQQLPTWPLSLNRLHWTMKEICPRVRPMTQRKSESARLAFALNTTKLQH